MFSNVVRKWRHVVLVGPISGVAGAIVGVAGVGNAGVTHPGYGGVSHLHWWYLDRVLMDLSVDYGVKQGSQ